MALVGNGRVSAHLKVTLDGFEAAWPEAQSSEELLGLLAAAVLGALAVVAVPGLSLVAIGLGWFVVVVVLPALFIWFRPRDHRIARLVVRAGVARLTRPGRAEVESWVQAVRTIDRGDLPIWRLTLAGAKPLSVPQYLFSDDDRAQLDMLLQGLVGSSVDAFRPPKEATGDDRARMASVLGRRGTEPPEVP